MIILVQIVLGELLETKITKYIQNTQVYSEYKVYSEDNVYPKDRVYPITLVIFHKNVFNKYSKYTSKSSKTHINPTITSILSTYSLIR